MSHAMNMITYISTYLHHDRAAKKDCYHWSNHHDLVSRGIHLDTGGELMIV